MPVRSPPHFQEYFGLSLVCLAASHTMSQLGKLRQHLWAMRTSASTVSLLSSKSGLSR